MPFNQATKNAQPFLLPQLSPWRSPRGFLQAPTTLIAHLSLQVCFVPTSRPRLFFLPAAWSDNDTMAGFFLEQMMQRFGLFGIGIYAGTIILCMVSWTITMATAWRANAETEHANATVWRANAETEHANAIARRADAATRQATIVAHQVYATAQEAVADAWDENATFLETCANIWESIASLGNLVETPVDTMRTAAVTIRATATTMRAAATDLRGSAAEIRAAAAAAIISSETANE
ncbi:hypothetical protein B0T25DRAFT_228112 [Lasiosphaeria hispida]|uniref:Uncharacterized protein n=1 Tax=Lasiosphaeria hispida TaxID=260671 RepID=A0AAJ0HDC9_9PEZI|nr:hypothetical protein B0T25DRAFT_228112 [Lasiosphaeria hispida]